MAEEEQEVEVTQLSNKVLIQLKKVFGMSAEDKFEAKRLKLALGATTAATGKAIKVGGAAMVGGIKGMFSGIGNIFKSGWWLAIFPLFTAAKWMIGGFGKILSIFKGVGILKAFKWMLKPFFWIASIWNFIKGWRGAKDLNNDNIISYAERFYQGLGQIVEFFTLGYVTSEKAAIKMQKWSKDFANAIADPAGTWNKVTKWWEDYSFENSVVTPITTTWDTWKKDNGIVKEITTGWDKVTNWWKNEFDFQASVTKPITEFFQTLPNKINEMWTNKHKNKWKEGVGDALWEFMLGKEKDGEMTGGVLGVIKEIFKKSNVVATGKMAGHMVKGIWTLFKYILIGKGAEFTNVESWGATSYYGFLRDKLQPNIGADGEQGSIAKKLGKVLGKLLKYVMEIFLELTSSLAMSVVEEFMPNWMPGKGDMLARMKVRQQNMLKMFRGETPSAPLGGDTAPKGKVSDLSLEGTGWLDPDGHSLNKQKLFDTIIPDFFGTRKERRTRQEQSLSDSWTKKGRVGWGVSNNKMMSMSDKMGMAGWNNMMEKTQNITMGLHKLFMDEEFSKFNLTSGSRTEKQQKNAMMGLRNLEVYRSRWGKHLQYLALKEGKDKDYYITGEAQSIEGKKDREKALSHLFTSGFKSSHQHGTGIDFSWPTKDGKRIGFSTLEKLVADLYPGAKLINEGNHIHLQPSNEARAENKIARARMMADHAMTLRMGGNGNGGNNGNGSVAVIDASQKTSTLASAFPVSPFSPNIDTGLSFGFKGFTLSD
jgi:hypothetical protein